MIADALVFLRNRLNQHFSAASGDLAGAGEDRVVFVDGEQKSDALSLRTDAVTVLLYRIEKEAAVRQGDPYVRAMAGGGSQKVRPDVGMNLHVLFIAKFKDYGLGLQYLSQVIRYFQTNNVFDRQAAPDLGAEIAELALDLVTMTVTQQNELWSLFRTAYLPSVAYRLRTVVFLDDAAAPPGAPATIVDRRGLE